MRVPQSIFEELRDRPDVLAVLLTHHDGFGRIPGEFSVGIVEDRYAVVGGGSISLKPDSTNTDDILALVEYLGEEH